MNLFLYNTLSKEKEKFKPLKKGLFNKEKVGLYTCGPTVYNYAHIGNLRTYVFEDILKRTLKYNNYKIKHVMNITDVGHLTDDADNGEDKLEKSAQREGKTAWEIAKFYTKKFQENLHDLNIEEPDIWCRATDHIPEQIKLVQQLIDKGVTYETSDGIYFDTTKINDYGKMANLKNQNLKAGTRVKIGEKKNPHDFALWKFSQPNEKRQMEWEAFGKKGFPGWHLECSAMSMKYLGEQFDIHCGGVDHIPIHHTNEIAQSETVTNKKPWVKYWLHGEFLIIDNDKMAKSTGNFITLDILKEKNIDPLAYRYFLLQTHYRKQLNFSWEALEAAQNGLHNLYKEILKIKKTANQLPKNKNLLKNKLETEEKLNKKNLKIFQETINNDLNTPAALSFLWHYIKDVPLLEKIKYKTILDFDKIFGLGLANIKETTQIEIPKNVQKLLKDRLVARKNKNWTESDRLRDEINKLGFNIEDTKEGQKITK